MAAHHRRDIDGLRAIAVMAIMCFHAGFAWCEGGYRGVDMFFVISGFLITGILLRELEAGMFTLSGFYERRARRILPALFVMLAVVVVAAHAWLLPADLKLFGQNVTAIVLFASNVLFWFRAGGFDFYFEPSAQLNPLLHTWSLGVEEQFYLVFPLLLVLCWRVRRQWLFPAVVLTAIASFAFSNWIGGQWTPEIRVHAEADFYLLPSRTWQLMLGALVACAGSVPATTRSRWLRWLSEVASAAGLAMIIYSMVIHGDPDVYFPALHAVPATLGAALILAFGAPTWTGRLLSIGPLVGVGLISYSAYLWHQPLFAFSHYLSLNGSLSVATRLVVLGASLIVAWVSWRWIETPFRARGQVSRAQIWRFSVVGGAVALSVGLWLALVRTPIAFGHLLPRAVEQTLSNSSLPDTMRLCAPDHAAADSAEVGCAVNPAATTAPAFLVVGDSHAGALLPAFRQLSERSGQAGRLVALRGCPPLFDVFAELSAACQAMQPTALAYAQRSGISRVFLVARWSGYTDGDYAGHINHYITQREMEGYQPLDGARTTMTDGLKRTLNTYVDAGMHVVLVAQVPQQEHRPLGMYLQAFLRPDGEGFLKANSISRARHEAFATFMNQTLAPYRTNDRVTVVDLSNALCSNDVCAVGTLADSYYWDESHLSEPGARMVVAELLRQSMDGAIRVQQR